ncbi:transcriptional regulator, TetR family [Paenibacillus algorifonticola]|uniref:Transcriptional regulator, TetR family n=1 Tax=Paenibacillus algorifonticola TaxID=684063 RepID=A0A1I2G115_9BACL|nr:TetR/AcrR family transcriptional regulator [Paenibacillus algorifonticola]SFF11344.1 transcriptional regulator, TetR family [Paenibacillus algorifonticola]
MSGVFAPNPNDPRVIRTRQLILDAFMWQLNHMDFHTMTIMDITKKATINRATFYAHFPDKYALLEALLADAFMEYVLKRVDARARLTEETVQELIFSLCDYHESSNKCLKKYDSVAPIIEKNIKKQLDDFILQLLTQGNPHKDQKTLEHAATLLSWSIYGITYQWNQEGRQESPSALASKIVPLIIGGITQLNAAEAP